MSILTLFSVVIQHNLQNHPQTMFIVDEDACLELRVKTHRYFKGLMEVHKHLIDPN